MENNTNAKSMGKVPTPGFEPTLITSKAKYVTSGAALSSESCSTFEQIYYKSKI